MISVSGIQEIAHLTGLSKSTVSRALRGLPSVADVTAATVRKTADELGYIPSSAAAGLATGRSRVVGVVVPTINRWFYITVLEGVDAELRAAGYDLILFNLGGRGGDRERVFHRSILRKRVDAMVILGVAFGDAEREQLRRFEHPMVVVGGAEEGVRHMGVDDRAVAIAATNHLLDLGHTQIAHIGGEDESGMNLAVPLDRREGFLTAMTAAGHAVPGHWMLNGAFSFRGGYAAMRTLLDEPERAITAVFVASDEMAFGAIVAVREAGLRVPEDISIVGIDGHENGPVYGLTTFAQDPFEQGVTAARTVLAEIEGAPALSAFPSARYELIERGSTAAPAPANLSPA